MLGTAVAVSLLYCSKSSGWPSDAPMDNFFQFCMSATTNYSLFSVITSYHSIHIDGIT